MDLTELKKVVDDHPDEITPLKGDLVRLYAHLGLYSEGSFSRRSAGEELRGRIRSAFLSGHQSARMICRSLREQLIQRDIIDGEVPDPYFSVLDAMVDALGSQQPPIPGEAVGDWPAAIRAARDFTRLSEPIPNQMRERVHARAFEVAKAAKQLQIGGVRLLRDREYISIEPDSETRLVRTLEGRIAVMGGVNLSRRIFGRIAPLYDAQQERYHVVSRQDPTGGGRPQIPFGYLLLLAAKHFAGSRPIRNTDQNWTAVCTIATCYATVLDVQNYTPTIWRVMDAAALLRYIREVALYDIMFRIPQIRGSDVVHIARGIFRLRDFDRKYEGGYSLKEIFEVVEALMAATKERRGPVSFDVKAIAATCSSLDATTIKAILDDVLTHRKEGPNQFFSKPTDAPTGMQPELGHDFFQRPLLSADRQRYWIIDHSFCALPCLEALLGMLRGVEKDFDASLGPSIETFLRDELAAHGVGSSSGTYKVGGEDGECDIVVETSAVIIFFEVKKKPLTRRAQAGSDAHLLVDLASSLLAAQVQAGWHEVRLRKHGFLDLDHAGVKYRVELKGRAIERIAITLTQYGALQDRVFLKQFFEATLHADFAVSEPSMKKAFAKLNELLADVRRQTNELHPGETTLHLPFFHFWFLSVPQVLVLLDDVNGPESFKEALFKTKALVTGSSDFYHDFAWMRRAAAPQTPPPPNS